MSFKHKHLLLINYLQFSIKKLTFLFLHSQDKIKIEMQAKIDNNKDDYRIFADAVLIY